MKNRTCRADRTRRADLSHSGFTLIELLVASVLTSILLVSVLSIVRITMRRLRPTVQVPSESLLSILRADLTNAKWVRVAPDRVELAGPLATNDHYLGLQTFARITYASREVSIDNQRHVVLFRQEDSASRTATEMLWLDVQSLVLENDLIDDPLEEELPSTLQEAGWNSLAPTLRFRLVNVRGERIFSESIVRN